MKTLIENDSLRSIINQINTELVEYEDPTKLRIVSKNKPGFVILLVNVETGHVAEDIARGYVATNMDKMSKKEIKFETNTFDYVVFTLINDESDNLLIVNSTLFELVLASQTIIADESGKHKVEDSVGWSLDSKDWSLIDVNEIGASEKEK